MGVEDLGLGSSWGSWFEVEGFRVEGSGFRVQRSGRRV